MPETGEDWGFPNRYLAQGSADYYVARFAPAPRRHAVACGLAYATHMDRLVRQANDPGVARLKLDWWREEIGSIRTGSPRHPLAAALLGNGVHADWQAAAMHTLVDAAEERILGWAAADAGAFHARCRRVGEAAALLLLDARADPRTRLAAGELGAYSELVLAVRDLGARLRAGDSPLGEEMLQAAGVHGPRSADDAMPGLRGLLAGLVAAHPFDIDAGRDPALDPVFRRFAQASALARRLRRAGYPVDTRHVGLAPIVSLWHAWRGR